MQAYGTIMYVITKRNTNLRNENKIFLDKFNPQDRLGSSQQRTTLNGLLLLQLNQ